jgi:hypothetical protein
MRIHHKRPSIALSIALVAFVSGAVGVLAACGQDEATRSTTTSPTAAPPKTAATSKQSFVSDLYGYSVDSWTGKPAKKAWDGTGSPGDGDPTVDSLTGPNSEWAFGFARPTKDSLKKFVAKFQVADSKVHPCPTKPEASRRTTISGEPAIVHEEHCPGAGGPFVLQAFTTHAGHVYVFFTYGPSGNEAAMRDGFGSLLQGVSLDA